MVATDAPQLTAMAVTTDSRRRFPKRWHVADVKNIAGDDQATLRDNQNSTNIAQSIKTYVYDIANDAPRLTSMAIAIVLCHPLSKR